MVPLLDFVLCTMNDDVHQLEPDMQCYFDNASTDLPALCHLYKSYFDPQ